MSLLQLVLGIVALALALWLVVLMVRDVLPGDREYGVLATLEVGMLVELVWGLVRVFGDHGDVNVAAYLGYLVGSVLVLPIAVVWSLGERTRAGTGVLLVGLIVVPVLFLRLDQLWAAR